MNSILELFNSIVDFFVNNDIIEWTIITLCLLGLCAVYSHRIDRHNKEKEKEKQRLRNLENDRISY